MIEDSPAGLARMFVALARDLEAAKEPTEVLERIVQSAVTTIDGCEEAGVLLVNRRANTFESPAVTGALVTASDEAQLAFDEGPCLDAARHERSFLIDDMAAETRWPRYAPRAVELGVGSMMGFELFAQDHTLGALDLYAHRPGAFDEHAREIGWVFASHAAIALAAAQRAHSLRAGYDTRQEIGAAVGVLMERHRLTSDKAFDMLKETSSRTNVKLREVAAEVVRTGQLPSIGE
ncbi:ANTAR domain-containing protein [Murinocardiopsis flavida]|uniref:ANTAR domain-containing protein n=1 Tax=Murinocardiopsis flavida TaxID=645275 RepID=A0A2P8CJ95_9ACTN|nr:GAF and ANTAR domain-containing protein [Murinocardiopsis flavida]PSK85012.1 ANTAR domain-containing protein [Murinocardiopsis flavida]